MDTDLFAACLIQLHEFEPRASIGIHSFGLSIRCANLRLSACMDAHWQRTSVITDLFNRSFLRSMVYLLSGLVGLFTMYFAIHQVFLYYRQFKLGQLEFVAEVYLFFIFIFIFRFINLFPPFYPLLT